MPDSRASGSAIHSGGTISGVRAVQGGAKWRTQWPEAAPLCDLDESHLSASSDGPSDQRNQYSRRHQDEPMPRVREILSDTPHTMNGGSRSPTTSPPAGRLATAFRHGAPGGRSALRHAVERQLITIRRRRGRAHRVDSPAGRTRAVHGARGGNRPSFALRRRPIHRATLCLLPRRPVTGEPLCESLGVQPRAPHLGTHRRALGHRRHP